jgi:hypothetical protein
VAAMDGVERTAEECYAHCDYATAKAGRWRKGRFTLSGWLTERASDGG